MNHKTAVELTRAMWIFLAEDISREKQDHPFYGGVYSDTLNACPMCEYHCLDCDSCFLSKHKAGDCFEEDSLFQRWDRMSSQKAARKIVKLCEKELKRICQ